MARLGIDQFRAFFVWYKGLLHQDLAIAELWKLMPVSLLEEDQLIGFRYRDPAIEEDPEVPVCLVGRENENSWGGVLAAAKKAGAEYPEVVAAQWALESAWGDTPVGTSTFLASKLRATSRILCTTWDITTVRTSRFKHAFALIRSRNASTTL